MNIYAGFQGLFKRYFWKGFLIGVPIGMLIGVCLEYIN